ncbi:MAG: DUF1254 domain-containing protein [Anaerolineales bacterium]|nr:DUF1254 domain-containing protein [Anaerolineales bacterium]
MPAQPSVDFTEKVKLAAEVFIYGYPLVYNLHEIAAFVAGSPRFPMKAEYNRFGHARELAGPGMKFVSPNNDTLYSIAMCDVRNGPVVLHTPDTGSRYYVLQFVDAWTNNFAYIGSRGTGTAEASYLLVGHDYQGEAPKGMRVVRAPSSIFAIIGRISVDGVADLPAVHALQDRFTLTPLSVYTGGAAPKPASGVPQPDSRVKPELAWWEEFRVALAAFPPPAADAPFVAACATFGLTAPDSPYIQPDADLETILVAGEKAAEQQIEQLIQHMAKPVNGWQNALHGFDYNLDHFEIGAIDAPEWKIADRKIAYVTRALIARAGLWGNHGYEANYQMIYVDADNQPLSSEYRYELHLSELPPVDAFWSLTMYDAHEFYLVDNVINRYSIGDRTPGIQYDADGSLTIYLQKDSPGADKESNWLPAPQSGAFRPLMRMYQPKQVILDGSYVLPAIVRVG